MMDRVSASRIRSAMLFAATLVALVLFPSIRGFAQEKSDSVDTSPPHRVVVVTRDGQNLTGILYRISTDTVQLYSERDGGVLLVPSEIAAVHPMERRTLRAGLLGATLGVVTVFALEFMSDSDPPYVQWDPAVYVLGGSIGLAIGASIGYNQWYCDCRHDIWDEWRSMHGIQVSLAF